MRLFETNENEAKDPPTPRNDGANKMPHCKMYNPTIMVSSEDGAHKRGVLLVPLSSSAISPIYDGLDVNVTSQI